MAARRKRWKTILPTVTLTAIPFVTEIQPAHAFFPPPPPPPVIVPPVSPPPVVDPPCTCPPPPPNCVPEPTTIVSSLIGLAALAGYRVTRRNDDKTEERNC
jgi:hypothetical protein